MRLSTLCYNYGTGGYWFGASFNVLNNGRISGLRGSFDSDPTASNTPPDLTQVEEAMKSVNNTTNPTALSLGARNDSIVVGGSFTSIEHDNMLSITHGTASDVADGGLDWVWFTRCFATTISC